ncbi:MAG: ATP-dependent Clp protease ATP-binding subunit [Planctomycetes bacterium]|jgi:ATP-dependent Clp protease ATP-binding subunit ClpC|nr:ATP-dependent Clp protease ATP-binding subunit [Planctomycetota bacterium]MBT4028968.1 ATP-dependent Clp protease ATP-binding subunit [Planctomycetota bacterium]MBT5119457.1 ATP-dependent Clp protease ATP-binding subunit [Planctomycetota bacterium]MBT7013287.1 ATP-dependent Clp protease ATP-binding subunit [Planctomycetota bacterium]
MDLHSLSSASLTVMDRAAQEMYDFNHNYLGVEHLFLGLLLEPCPRVEAVCRDAGFDQIRVAATLKAWSRRQSKSKKGRRGEIVFTPRLSRVQSSAGFLCARLGDGLIEPLHLFQACLAEERSAPTRLIDSLSAQGSPSAATILAEVESQLGYNSLAKESAIGSSAIQSPEELAEKLTETYLWGRDLSAMAQSGRLGEVLGRQDEIVSVVEVLCRQHHNQVLLLADSGVGATKLIDGLALFLCSDAAPKILQGMRLCRLEAAVLLSGTPTQAEVESRVSQLIQAALPGGDAILVLEDFHLLFSGHGFGRGLSDLIRSALSRPGLRVLGTATPKGLAQAQITDPHLASRFESIQVQELSEETSLEILKTIQPALENFHGVEIVPESLQEAVLLSVRYLGNRRLPGKAIDVLDQACSSLLLAGLVAGEANLEATQASGDRPTVNAQDVARVVARLSGVPIERVGKAEAEQLLGLEETLQSRLFGQNEAVAAVSAAVRAGRAGVSDARRPLATLLFAGPTGVGKTELAKVLAEEWFGSEDNLVRLDMTEYSEAHSVARLVGAPPGYVGFGQDGVLISALRKQPYSVVLFDELEKAHPDVFDLLLPVLDEGRLQSATGVVADMRHALLVLTTNLLSEPGPALGFGASIQKEEEVDLRAKLTTTFRPEFINRIDAVIPFRSLQEDDLLAILKRLISRLVERVAEQGIQLKVSTEVEQLVLKYGTDLRFGARPLERALDQLLRHPLAEAILREEALKTGRLLAVIRDGKVAFEA